MENKDNIKQIIYLFLLYYKTTEMKVPNIYKFSFNTRFSYHSTLTLAWEAFIEKLNIKETYGVEDIILFKTDRITFNMEDRLNYLNHKLEYYKYYK